VAADALNSLAFTRRWLTRLIVMVPLALGAAACGVDEFGLSTGPRQAFTSDQRPALLVGAWVSSIYVRTTTGVQASETIWDFRNDGTAVRTTILRHLNTGISDQTVQTGLWGTQGQWVVVTFDGGGTIRLRYSVAGGTLFLDSREFQRIW
jgi:hypothetical protein